MTIDTSTTRGIHHVGLTVSKLRESVGFFTDALGFKVVGREDGYPAVFVSDGSVLLTLWRAAPDAPVPFDRRSNVGLHHIALRVPDDTALERLFERLRHHPGVVVEFSPERLGDGPLRHAMVLEPSGVRVELIVAE